MDFITAVKTVVQEKYVTVSGRASRSEFWWFVLFQFIVGFVTGLLDGSGTLNLLATLVLLLPAICVSVRRLHDLGQSGWLLLLGLIPILGGLGLLVWFAMPGTAGDNRFGADPVARAA